MKKNIHNLWASFLFLLSFVVVLGFLLPINTYENNYIVRNGVGEQMVISSSVYNEIKDKLKPNNKFYYYEKNQKKEQTITQIITSDNHSVIHFQPLTNERYKPLTQISFYLKKTPYWFEIFKHY